MKTEEELKELTKALVALNKKLASLNEENLELVTGGEGIPKDYYENIILSTLPEEHNVILTETGRTASLHISGWKNDIPGWGGVSPSGYDCSGLIT